jgi:hypothetical protein
MLDSGKNSFNIFSFSLNCILEQIWDLIGSSWVSLGRIKNTVIYWRNKIKYSIV